MKRGMLNMEVVIVAVLVLLFAGAVAHGVMPRFQKGQSIVERFLPEKCADTGKTRENYEAMIFDALTARKPDAAKILAIMKEAESCFPGTEMPEPAIKFTLEQLRKRLPQLFPQSSTKALQEALKIYDDAVTIPLQQWTNPELLLFSRALYHLQKNRHEETLKLLSLVREREDRKGTLEEAEALTLSGLILLRDGKREDAHKIFQEVIKRFTPKTENAVDETKPELMFFLGQARLAENVPGAAVLALEIARKSKIPYTSYGASAEAVRAYKLENENKKAAELFEKILPYVDFKESVWFTPAVEAYANIPSPPRKTLDCQLDKQASLVGCMCQGKIIMLPTYCCAGFTSIYPCYLNDCVGISDCAQYSAQECLVPDPCELNFKYSTEAWYIHCELREGKCITKSEAVPS